MVSVTEQWAQFSDRRPALARRCCRRSSTPARPVQRGVSLSWRAAESRCWAACRRGCSASRSPASSPTRSPCRRATATRSCARLMEAGDDFGIAPYGTEALGVMRIEKGHVAGNELNGQTTAARSRSRPDDVDEEGFHRPRHGRRARRLTRSGPAGAGRHPAGRPRASVCAPARISSRRVPRPIAGNDRAT